MTAHDTDDDAADKGRGTTRRGFLGAASATAALAAAGTSTATDDQSNDEPQTEDRDSLGFSAGLTLPNQYDNPADYELRPSQLADEKVAVGLDIDFGMGKVSLAFTTEEAEAFIDRFETAVERGNKGLGKRDQ